MVVSFGGDLWCAHTYLERPPRVRILAGRQVELLIFVQRQEANVATHDDVLERVRVDAVVVFPDDPRLVAAVAVMYCQRASGSYEQTLLRKRVNEERQIPCSAVRRLPCVDAL